MKLVMVIEVPELQGTSLEGLSGADNHSVEVYGTLPKNSKHRRKLRIEVREEDEVREQTQN